jgi:hypothetical protein
MSDPDQDKITDELRQAVDAVVRLDDEILGDPARFRRAIADVLPEDERTGNLLGLSTELGVPALIREGHSSEAVAHLMDHGGIDQRVARSIIQLWASVLSPGTSVFDSFAGIPGRDESVPSRITNKGLPEDELGEVPTGAYLVRATSLSGLDVFVAISTPDGCFATVVRPSRTVPLHWRRLASPDSPLSRDLCVHHVSDDQVLALWSDRTGIQGITARRALVESGKETPNLALGRPTTFVPTEPVNQIRYPIAAISTSQDMLDVFWTSDRQKLSRSSLRTGSSTSDPQILPASCYGGERLAILDALQLSEHHCVLATLTDRFRILVADWDLDIDLHGEWRSVAVPMDDMMAISMVRVGQRPLLFASTKSGRLFAVDIGERVGDSWPWWQVQLPDALGESATRSISLAACDDNVWLARSGTSGLCVVSARLRSRRLEISDIDWILT